MTGQDGHLTTLRAVPSLVALSQRGQTHFSSLRQMRGNRDGQTSPGIKPRLSPHPRLTPIATELVHARTRQGRGKGVHDLGHSRSLAFSRLQTPHGAKDQAGIRWLSELGLHSRI